MTKRAGILLLVLAAGCVDAPAPQPPADCEHCAKPLVAGATVELVTAEGVMHRYRCVHCALTAFHERPGDWTLVAPTPTGETVTVTRHGNAFRTAPASAVFLILPEEAGECIDRHRVFRDEAALRSYVAAHGGLGEPRPKAWTLVEIEGLLAAGQAR